MCTALVPKYAHQMGATAVAVGMVTSVFAITSLCLKLVSAPVIDTYNRKHVLIISIIALGITFVGYAISLSVGSLVAFRMLNGCSQAFLTTCALALATSMLPKERLAQGIGFFSLSQAICQAVGPSIALNISVLLSYKAAFIIAAAFAGLAIVFTGLIKEQSKRNLSKKLKVSLKSMIATQAILPAFFNMVFALPYWAIWSFLIIYCGAQGIPNSQAGLFFTVYAIILLFTRPFYGRMADKVGYVKVLVPGTLLFAVAFVFIFLAHNLAMILVAAVVSALGFGSCFPILQALAMKRTPAEHRGAASCTFYMGHDLGLLFGPIIAGCLVDTLGYQSMWLCMIVPSVLTTLLIILFRKNITEPAQVEPDAR